MVGAVSRFLQQLLCLVGIIAVVLFRLAEIRIVGRVDAVGWLRRAVQELGDRIAIDCVIESLAQSLVVKHRTLTHIEDIRPDMRVRPQADLATALHQWWGASGGGITIQSTCPERSSARRFVASGIGIKTI